MGVGVVEGAEDPEVVDGDEGADVEMALHLNNPDGLPFPWFRLPSKESRLCLKW